MDWVTFVTLVVSNPLLILSWEFLSSCFCAWLVFRFTGKKMAPGDFVRRLASKPAKRVGKFLMELEGELPEPKKIEH